MNIRVLDFTTNSGLGYYLGITPDWLLVEVGIAGGAIEYFGKFVRFKNF